MPLNINTNSSAAAASFHLSKNQDALQKSLARLFCRASWFFDRWKLAAAADELVFILSGMVCSSLF